MRFGLIGLTVAIVLGLLACSPTYPSGVIKDRSAAISAWRQHCGGEQASQFEGKESVELKNGKWIVGYHDNSAILMGVFDAKSGKMERCYRGAIN